MNKRFLGLSIAGLTVLLGTGWWALGTSVKRSGLWEEETYSNGPIATADQTTATRSPASGAPNGEPKDWKELKECWAQETCPFSQEDPRSFDLAAGKKAVVFLHNSREAFLKGNLSASELEEQALEAMAIPDGHLQEEALKAFSALPPSPRALDSMLENLALTPSPPLIEQAMKEFERYLGTSEEARVQQFLADFIARGGQFSSEKASELILEFLNEKSEPLFQQALASMVPESTPARHLRSALAQYHQQRSGG